MNETWEQWSARLSANRKARIEAETDPAERARLIGIDASCAFVEAFVAERMARYGEDAA